MVANLAWDLAATLLTFGARKRPARLAEHGTLRTIPVC
jgi:hypothetical protein